MNGYDKVESCNKGRIGSMFVLECFYKHFFGKTVQTFHVDARCCCPHARNVGNSPALVPQGMAAACIPVQTVQHDGMCCMRWLSGEFKDHN